ncbi:Hsp70 family protein [Cellulomonas xiejunii]|uniref:Hsp70 family protein n=1 Tax=Cellulomonas xiejunii TaxID=2968083 RepID=A0ABY5KRN5_9CELL|nr:Hsp70 family protein [Cellulomonas xiejunii]MCC2315551.1 Hsp70 family protein [Cellulomonas xiejunii]MCC2320715.1 Hsp70 family protein [Cellulomonas xiejunii]UUI71003.1 Hsp70 family protein [Cellulomonas xiejunii]
MTGYTLGVDVGTSRTAAAVWRDGRATTVNLGDRTDTIPSAVLLRADGALLVGDAAVRRGVLEPERLARGFKRRLGDPTGLLLGDDVVDPVELTGAVLRHVVDAVREREGGEPDHVTLTHPATWGALRRDLLVEAAGHARLADVGLLAEPVAAAVHYAALDRLPVGAVVAVYDLGGGTFDATVVVRTADGYELRGEPGGDEHIGGEDVDEAVLRHVVAALGRAWTSLDAQDPAVLAALAAVRDQSVLAKEALSSDVEAAVPVLLPGVTRQVRITRGELETAIRIDVLRTVDTLARTVASAGVRTADLHAVLLTGGSSRIPLVSELIAAEIGAPVVVDAHPKYAVCLGAALSAAGRVLPAPVVPAAPTPTSPGPVFPVAAGLGATTEAGEVAVRLLGDDVADAVPAGEERHLLAAPEPSGVVLAATPQDAGVVLPVDQAVRTREVRGALRHLAQRDDVEVTWTGDRRRGALLALAVLLGVVAVVGVLVVASLARGA